jgi:hypothetical protein
MTRTFWYWQGWTIHSPTRTAWFRVPGSPAWVFRTDSESRRGLRRLANLDPTFQAAVSYPKTWADIELLPMPINLGSEAHPKWVVLP